MGKPRLPWKRGAAAWQVARTADAIRARLARQPRSFLSLRQTAESFGISTQPVRDWVRLKHLRRTGPRSRFARTELERFLGWLEARAEPFASENYTARFAHKPGRWPRPFGCLHRSQFLWPAGKNALAPRELAGLVGCHPSLVIKALHYYGRQLGRRRSPCRWEISRQRWQNIFFGSQITKPRLPALPRQAAFSTAEAAAVLGRWGVSSPSVRRVREMIRRGELERLPPAPGKRRWQVSRKSLEQFRKFRLTA